MSNSTKGILLASTCAFMWALLAIALKIALKYVDSYTIVWWRFAFSFVTVATILLFKSKSQFSIIKRSPFLLILAGILLGFNFIGYQQGVNYSGPAVSQIIIQLGAISFAIVGFLFFKESINRIKIIGFILALIGFIFFYYKQIGHNSDDSSNMMLGIIWLLIGSFTWAGYAVVNKILAKKITPLQINLYLYGIPTLMFLPFANFKALFAPHPLVAWLILIFVAANTIISYGSLSIAMKYIEANKTSMIIILNPIITFILLEILLWFNVSWFEAPAMQPIAYIGAGLVLLGAVFATGGKK